MLRIKSTPPKSPRECKVKKIYLLLLDSNSNISENKPNQLRKHYRSKRGKI